MGDKLGEEDLAEVGYIRLEDIREVGHDIRMVRVEVQNWVAVDTVEGQGDIAAVLHMEGLEDIDLVDTE